MGLLLCVQADAAENQTARNKTTKPFIYGKKSTFLQFCTWSFVFCHILVFLTSVFIVLLP